MQTDQRKLGQKFANFVSQLGDVDYRIAVTTTDLDGDYLGAQGTLATAKNSKLSVITPETENASQAFLNLVHRRELGASDEQSMGAAAWAIRRARSENAGFFREGVDLAIVVLTDEDELSYGPKFATQPEEVIRTFRNVFGTTKRLSAYGIIIQPGDQTCLKAQQEEDMGSTYATFASRLAKMTGGFTTSICDADYGRDLDQISDHVRKLVDAIDLQQTPIEGSVTVSFSGGFSTRFTVQKNRVTFSTPPPAGTQIEVKYQVNP